ncbi:hypothetical protein SAMN05444274_10976 [Mariniphaga anaerophila]|uniref:Uncharacterized protein n=1 Tax=Mariniphaga anaerophila TaxID=1484053 RepID=A0A1M5EKP7_9BACT|nr:DUF4175 family protein [Mariniphaga anaerophila]SHF79819.1 hypothetical protein SAMN05444274_10976 [Mariniphaga anaerophila]
MTENFNILVHKLNAFRTKYYSFKLLKGIIITLFFLLALFTVFSLVEYFVYLSSEIRKILFFGFVIFSGLLTVQFVFVPLFRLLHILKPIDVKTSSAIIQRYFPKVEDKLLNIIELSNIEDTSYSNDIVLASIDQKIDELSVFDFKQAVQYKNLKIVLFYFLVSLLVTVSVFVVNRSVFATAPQRIIHYNTQYVKPAPFEFNLVNQSLRARKGDSFTIKVEVSGDELPEIVYINIEGNNYLMKSSAAGFFEFEMASVINPVKFYFTDLKYNSDSYSLQLLPKPGINHFDVIVSPPSYTGLPVLEHENVGDLQVPHGTIVKWNFQGIDIDTLYLNFSDSVNVGAAQNLLGFEVEKQFFKASAYHVYIKNNLTEPELALSYGVDVLPDLYPEIKIVQIQDSLKMTRFFFKGEIGDDYGFSGLNFHYNINNADSAIAIPFVKNLNDQDFYFSFDFADLEKQTGAVSYYFSVSDNDVLNKFKTTTSDNFVFNIPDKEEVASSDKEQFKNLEKMLQESEQLTRDIQKDLENLQLKNMDTNVSDWEKSQMVNQILSKQSALENLYEKIKQDNQKLNNYLDSFSEQNEEIKEKQKQIEELFNEVFTDELKKLLEEFQNLAEEFDNKKLNELTRQMNFTYEDLQKQLDKNLEMLRKMKVEQKLQNVIDEMNRMAEEESKMAEDVSNKAEHDKIEEKLNEHKKELENLRNEIQDALQMNKELEKPMNFDDFDEEFDDIQKSMEESQSDLQKNNRKKSASGFKENSEKMQNTAFAMQQMLNSNTKKQNMENIQNLRQILSNLVYLSFQQESVLDDLSDIHSIDPKLNELNLQQRRIKDQSQIVKDSLYALSKRTPQITSLVNNELITMELNLDKAMDEMTEGLYPKARASQQFVMTASNNLALMLDEALQNLEKQMANAQPGDQQCENPGQGQSGMNLLKQQSESIKQQLEQMIQQMKNGSPQNMNQQMGQSLMQHEMMQQMLREIMNNGSVGSGTRKALQEIDDMLEQNRRQLVNKNVHANMINRQNLITTRLLEAEKAELQREFEDERESRSAEEFHSNPAEFFEYEIRDNSTLEYLNRDSHRLNNFYNKKYKQYLNNMQKD